MPAWVHSVSLSLANFLFVVFGFLLPAARSHASLKSESIQRHREAISFWIVWSVILAVDWMVPGSSLFRVLLKAAALAALLRNGGAAVSIWQEVISPLLDSVEALLPAALSKN